jgi:hypothetical protein
MASSYQLCLWKQESFLVLKAFFRSLLVANWLARGDNLVCNFPIRSTPFTSLAQIISTPAESGIETLPIIDGAEPVDPAEDGLCALHRDQPGGRTL